MQSVDELQKKKGLKIRYLSFVFDINSGKQDS